MKKADTTAGRKRKPRLYDLTREFMSPEGLRPFFSQLETGNDRTVAIAGGAAIEQNLVRLLQGRFIDLSEAEIASTFYNMGGPLSTFSQRITLCYLLGQISKKEKRDLTNIRKIRNVFAHRIHDLSFEAPLIAELCVQLNNYTEEEEASPRELYRSCVIALHTLITERHGVDLEVRAQKIIQALRSIDNKNATDQADQLQKVLDEYC